MKSLILSLILTFFASYVFMTLIDGNNQTWVSKLPTSLGYVVIVVVGIAYLVALYWGVTGIVHGQRLANFFGIMLSLFGVGLFVYGASMSAGKGQAKEGQFDYALNSQSPDMMAIQPILSQAKMQENELKFVNFWDLASSQAKIAICVQKGKIIGLSIKGVTLSDVSSLSNLPALSELSINYCNLSNIENLHLPKAERLNLNNNALQNLLGINAPNVKWLDVKDNKLSSLAGIENLPKAQYFNYGGNDISDFSAAAGHEFLNNLATQK